MPLDSIPTVDAPARKEACSYTVAPLQTSLLYVSQQVTV